jgi:hypothetical protein
VLPACSFEQFCNFPGINNLYVVADKSEGLLLGALELSESSSSHGLDCLECTYLKLRVSVLGALLGDVGWQGGNLC